MNLCQREFNMFRVIDISGRIHKLRDSGNLRSIIDSLLEQEVLFIALNLKEVSYLDSGAVNTLIHAHTVVSQKNGKLVLLSPNEYVTDVIQVVGIDKIVKIYSSEEDFFHDYKSQ